MSDVVPLHEVDNSGAPALETRGVQWPMAGFSPGRHTLLCEKCCRRHLAAERSTSCLPCAIAAAVDVGLRACASQTKAFHRGRQSGLDDVARFVAAGGKSSRSSPPAPMTPEQRDDVKRQARDADRRAVDPAGAGEVDDLIARTQAAQERIEDERRAGGTDQDGGDAA